MSVIVLILGCKSAGLVKQGGCVKRILSLVPLFLFCSFTCQIYINTVDGKIVKSEELDIPYDF